MRSKFIVVVLTGIMCGSTIALMPIHAHSLQTTSPCAPSNTVLAQDLASLFKWMMEGDDSSRVGARTRAAIPKVDSATVTFVSDTTLCRTAATAYTSALQDTTATRSVHVIKIGNRYIVLDPFKWAGQLTPAVTFDSTFSTELARVGR